MSLVAAGGRAARLVAILGVAVVAAPLAPARAADVTIGVGAPLSGPDAVFGAQVALGVQLAVADVNAAGGILGQKARVAARDDVADAKKAVAIAKGFVTDRVPIVIGHFSSATTVPASTVYADGGVLEITPSAVAPIVTDRGLATLFRTCGREDAQAATAAHYLLSRGARVALIHDRTASGKAVTDAVRKALAAGSAREAYYGSFEKGARDVGSLVARLKASGAQIAFFGGGPGDAGLLARQIRDAGVRITLMGGLAMASDDYAATAGPAAEGTLVVFPIDPRSRPAAADLQKRLAAKGVQADAYAYYAYAAVQVARQAAEATHTLEAAKLAAYMHGGAHFATVLGDLTFDAEGDPTTSDLTVWVWHKGATGKMTIDETARS